MLIAVIAGTPYVERQHLTFTQCAGYSSLLRSLTTEEVEASFGHVQYFCIAEARS